MSFSDIFIDRPVATTLCTIGVGLAGAAGYFLLPVSPLPQMDFPTISVSASLPGANPDTMAATVATPLERTLGRIAGITEMTSSSTLGGTRVTMQFDLDRNIDGAARDVQAGINAARSLLPTGLPTNPTYRKVNPADAPVMILAMTSKVLTPGQMYDSASTVVAQKLSQVQGIGQVVVGGSSLPAVRVDINLPLLNRANIGLEDVRNLLSGANANSPKGSVQNGEKRWQIYANDQLSSAGQYMPLVVAYRNGSAVRLSEIAQVTDSVQDIRNAGSYKGQPSVTLVLFRQPGANIIDTVDRVKDLLPYLREIIPQSIELEVAMERTSMIRASLVDVERSLIISVILVILVVFVFLRSFRATLIPSVAVPISLLGTFAVMYLLDYSLDNLSLMALAIATGFVVDDAVVVLENATRHLEEGMEPFAAARRGAAEVSFTVLSMSISLIAVFVPILLMGGVVGRLFREFAVTLSASILISMVVSLTTTPMMCARLLRSHQKRKHGWWYNMMERAFNSLQAHYGLSLSLVLKHPFFTLLSIPGTIVLAYYLFITVPKGFFPQQDGGRLSGAIQADQNISFQAMQKKMAVFVNILQNDPAIDNVVASIGSSFGGGSASNSGSFYIALKPMAERKISADDIIARLRKQLSHVPGATLYLQSSQEIRVGARGSSAQFQYTLQADDLNELRTWEPQVRRALSALPELADVNTDSQDQGSRTSVIFDRDAASRLGVSARVLDSNLNDAFGQRQVSVIYAALNQYQVIMEAAPFYLQQPATLEQIYVTSLSGKLVPLSAFSHYELSNTSLGVNHQGQFAASTISFNLAPNVAYSNAQRAIDTTMAKLGLPPGVRASYQGTASAFNSMFASLWLLIPAALIIIYIVLGMLYESTVHPITILVATIPSAIVGGLIALYICRQEFNLMSIIGFFLLIGIVKKNAIMMIDFAIDVERKKGMDPRDAIYQACLLRFRPILMTTMAALLGAVPLAVGFGEGSELRRPLGITIVGGLIFSQMLTLYTTPVLYLEIDRLRLFCIQFWMRLRGRRPPPKPLPAA